MAKSNDPNVIQVGLSADVEGFVKEIKKELASVKGLGLSDAIKDEIKSIEGMLDGLAKSFSDGMDMKLDTKTFAAFEVKVSKDMQAIDERVTSLEDSMQALITTMDTADSGKLSSALQDIGSKMQLLNGFTDETVKTMRELINIASKSNGLVQFADNATLGNLKKESELLERIKKVSGDLANTEDYDRGVEWGKNKKLATALTELSDAYKKVLSAKEQYDKAIKENADNFSLAQVKKEYAETFAYLNSLRDEADNVFGQDIANTQIPNEIHKILQDSREEIEGFYEWSVSRLSSVEEARNRINKKAAISVDKSENGKASIKIPMQVSTTGRGLAEQARRVLNIAQNNLTESLKVDFVLQSKYASRKTNDLLKEWQQQIGEIDSPELREKFEGLYDSIAKAFEKEININVTSNISKEEIKVKKTIEQIKKLVGNKIHIFPEFDIKNVDVAKLQKKVDKIAKQLKLNVDLLPKGVEEKTNEQLEALKALSDTLATKLDNLNKNYLSDIKKSLADILSLAQTLKDSAVQTDAPIDELVSSVKELATSLQKALGVFTNDDLDSIFVKMQNSVAGISGSLRGGDKNNLVVQLKEILALYKQYRDLGGTKELTDLGGQANVQKWLVNHANDEVAPADPFVIEGKNNANGYAEGIRSGIPTVRAAAKEMAEAALEEIRKTQNSNSPAKETEELGQDADLGYEKGLQENLERIKKAVSEKQQEVNEILEAQKPLDNLTQKMLSDNAKALGLDKTVEVIKDATAETNKFADSMQEVSETGNKLNNYCEEIALGLERIERAKILDKAGLMQGSAFDSQNLGDRNAGVGVAYSLVSASDELWKEVVDQGLVKEGSQKFNELRAFLSQYIESFLSQFNLTVEDIKKQLVEISQFDSSTVGFKPHNKKNNAIGSWQHYHSIGQDGRANDKFEGAYTYKTYARFADPRQLNQTNIMAIMKALSEAGFRGQVKVPGTGGVDRFVSSSDQLVIHGINSKMQKIAYEVLENQFGTLLSSLKAGFDKAKTSEVDGASFSEIVVNKGREIWAKEAKELLLMQQTEEVVASKKKEKRVIENVATAEKELASTRKGKDIQQLDESTSNTLKNAQKTSDAMKEVADNEDKATESAKILNNMYDNLGKIVLQVDKDAKEAADTIALIIKSAEKLEKVDSPFAGTKAWSSLNRRRKNDKAEDSIAAKNIQVFTSAYQKTGQKAILNVINSYVSKSNLNDDLKKRVQTLLSSAIKGIDEGVKTALKEAPQTETKTMTHKQFKEYLKKYAIWGQDEETFNYNFKVQKETMQKDGRAFRPINKNGKLGAWLYNVEVPVNQLSTGLENVQKTAEKTDEKLSQTVTTGRKKLDKVIEQYQKLYQEQQNLYKLRSPLTSENGDTIIRPDYEELGNRLAEVTDKMQSLTDRGFNNFKVNLHQLALGLQEVEQKTDTVKEKIETPSKAPLKTEVNAVKNLRDELTKIVSTETGYNSEDIANLLGMDLDDVNKRLLDYAFGGASTKQIVDGFMSVYEILHKDEEQAEKTDKAITEIGKTPSKGLQKHIDKYQELEKRQQEYLSKMSEMATIGIGKISNPEEYARLKYEQDLTSRQMQKEAERIRDLSKAHVEVAEAAEKQSNAEKQAVNNGVTPSLQKKIDKYTELKKRQQELFSQMSPKVNSKTGQLTIPDNYYDLKKEAMGLDTQMQGLVEKTYKNHNTSLLQLVDFLDKVTASTNDYNKAEEKQISQSASVSAGLQKKIDKYRELKRQQQELLESMSKMALTDSGHIEDPKAYASLKNKEDSVSRQINNLLEKAYKNNKANLNTYIGNDLEVSSSSAQVATDVQKAVDAIEAEGQAAQKGVKKKEKLTKAEKKLAKGSKEAASETDKAAEAIEKEYQNAEKNREKVLKEEQKYRRAIAKIPYDETAGMLKDMDTAKFNQNFTGAFQARIDELRDKLEKLFSSETIDLNQLEKAKAEFKDINNILSNTRNAAGVILADETSVSGLKANIASFYDQNTAMSSKFKKQIKDLLSLLEDGGNITRTELKAIKTDFNNISAEVKRLHQTGQSFGTSFLKQLKSANAQLIATYFSFQDFIRYAREGFQTIVEVDTALTELRKVSDASDDRLAQSFKVSTETAKELGSTISDVIGVTADWARLGYSVDEAEKLARITTLFQTVGDNMSSEETSSYMVSTLQGFQMATDQAMEIADKFNEVANNFAIDTKGIGESLQRSAASFNAANTSLSESIALVTATNTVVQDPSSVGTLWKTLSARIRGAKTELQELDEEEDEFTETTSKLQGLVKSLTGFDILEQDGKTFKSIYDIIIGIGKEWQNLTDIEQASLGEALAGKRNANALYAVLNNIETLENAYATAEDAQGSAMREQENYAKSIQYSIDVLKASAQEFWTTLINSGAAKKVIDFLTLLLNTLTKITEATNGIPIFAGAGLLAAFGKDPQGAVTKLSNTFERFFGFFKTGTTSITETINVLDGGASGLEAIQADAEVAADGMATLGTKTVATQSAFATLMANPITPWIVGIGLALGVAVIAWDTFTTTVKEAQKDVDKTAGKISSLQSEIKELQDMDYRTSDQEKRLDYLEQELKYQEQIFEIEKKRLLQEKIGNKFSDSFDRENYNTKFKLESNAQRGDTAAGLLASIKARNETLESNKELQQQYIDYLDKNRSNMSSDEIAEYTREIASLGETILDINDKNIVSVDSLHDKVQEFQAIIDDAQEGIDSGLLIGSDKADAEKIIENYTGLIKEINDVITPVLKESGLFDYSSAIESTFEKVEFDGIKEKLLEIAKSEDLSPELLTEKYSELIANLKLAGVDADALYKYLMKLSGLVDRSNLTDKINGQIRHGYGVGTLSGSEYDRHRLSNYINSLSEEDAQLVAGLDVDWSTFDADEVIEKMKSEIAKSHENPVTVDVEPTIVDSVEGINKRLKPQFDELGELYKSIFYGDNGFSLEHITNDQLQGIKSAFLDAEDERGEKIGVRYEGATEAVNEFIDTLTSAETKSKSLKEQQQITQDAVNKLATTYFYAAGGLRELNDETKDAIRQQFKEMGIVNIDEVIEGANKTQEWIDSLLDFDQTLETEYDKIHDWGLDEYAEQIENKTIQTKFGNVDMDKRAVITWTNELKKTYEKELASWNYNPEIGGIDTVFGGSKSFFAGDKEVEIAFTPIIETSGKAEFLGKKTVENYIQNVVDQATDEAGNLDIGKALEIDAKGFNTAVYDEYGHTIGQKFVHGVIAEIGDNAIDVSELMHFSGMSGAIQLAEKDIADLEAIEAELAAQGKTVADITQDDIDAWLLAGQVSEQAAMQLQMYVYAKALSNGTFMNETASVQSLMQLCKVANLGVELISELNELEGLSGRASAAYANKQYEYGDALMAEYRTRLSQAQSNIQAAWNEKFQLPEIDFSQANTDAGKAGGDAADAYVEAYEKEKKELENQRDMGIISEKEYLDKLKVLIDKFFKDRAEYAEKYMDEMKSYMDSLLSYYNSVISGVTTLLDHRINKIQEQKETTITALEEERDAIQERYQAEIDEIDASIKAKEKEIEAIDKQIQAIQDANDERERAMNLQKAEYELQRALHQRTKLVWIMPTDTVMCFRKNNYIG